LGAGTRVAGGWQLSGLAWPTNASLRARGFVAGGDNNGSSWFVETIINPPPPCDPPPSGLVSWWPGEGDANDIVGNNNGTLVGGATFAAGEVGQAFNFDDSGTQAVDIPRSSNLNITNQVTVEFWMKADPGNSMQSYQGFVTSDYYGISITEGNPPLGVLGIDFFINDNGTYYEIANANGGGAKVSAGVWHHIAGTYDGTELQLYVDGQPWGNRAPSEVIQRHRQHCIGTEN
jgi:hypothetical protein